MKEKKFNLKTAMSDQAEYEENLRRMARLHRRIERRLRRRRQELIARIRQAQMDARVADIENNLFQAEVNNYQPQLENEEVPEQPEGCLGLTRIEEKWKVAVLLITHFLFDLFLAVGAGYIWVVMPDQLAETDRKKAEYFEQTFQFLFLYMVLVLVPGALLKGILCTRIHTSISANRLKSLYFIVIIGQFILNDLIFLYSFTYINIWIIDIAGPF